MPVHHLTRSASEGRFAGQHLPEGHAQRVKIRSSVQGEPGKLFGAGKFWCSDKTSWRRNCGLEVCFSDCLRQTEIDNFCRDYAVILQTHQDVTRLNIAVNEFLFVYGSQTGGHLRRNFQGQLRLDPPRASDEVFKGFSLDEFHRIEVTATGPAQMEDCGNVRVTDTSR